MLRFYAARCFCFSISIALLSATAASSQVQQPALAAALKGDDVVSTITIGDTGAPVGYNAPYPVNTLVYPDGQVAYRVEWAMMRGEVGRMQKSFGSGTTFQVTSVDFKDDRLELKLLGRNRDSGRLKVMLGSGWQTRMTNATVIETLGKFFSLPVAQSEVPPVNGAALPTPSASVQNPPSSAAVAGVTSKSATALYSRHASATTMPGRVSENDVQNILVGLEQQKQSAQDGLRRSASRLSVSFRAFQSAYSRERGNQPAKEIVRLQSELGSDLIPRRTEDIDDIDNVFRKCWYVAQVRQAGGYNGRGQLEEYGPGSDSPAYKEAFLSGQAARDRATQDLRSAFARKESAVNAETTIILVEQALDKGDLLDANHGFGTLSGGTTPTIPEVAQYLGQSANLRSDLAAYSQASATPVLTATSLVTTIHAVANEQAQLAASFGKPLTSSYLQHRLDADKGVLRGRLDALPAFHFDPKLYTTSTVTQLRGVLLSAVDLAALMGDQAAMDLVHSWYGDAMYTGLNAKGQGITEAQLLETKLENQIAAEQRLRDQEQARREALIERRNSLASEIVNTALMITMLEEKFQLTQVIGYRMEANKQRASLSNLVRTNRTLLDSAVWNEVNQRFQQILPGLTLWQADRAQSILAELRQ
jgi:hypothetical protein